MYHKKKRLISSQLIFITVLVVTSMFLFAGCLNFAGTTDEKDLINNEIYGVSNAYRAQMSSFKPDTKIKALNSEEAESEGYDSYVSDGYEYVYSKNTSSQTYDGMANIGIMDSAYYPGALLKMSYNEQADNNISSVNLARAPINISVNLETMSGINPENLRATIQHPENVD